MLVTLNRQLKNKVESRFVKGKEFLVAPITILVEGVLNGSKGPLYYPMQEIEATAQQWENIPITYDHPMDSQGNALAATHNKQVWQDVGLGRLYNPVVHNNRLRVEGWFDVARLSRINPALLEALRNNQRIEVSTGLFTDNVNTQGDYKGKPYTAVATKFRPDHLAILFDKVGACSLNDGCGVLNSNPTGNVACGTGKGGGKNSKCAKSRSVKNRDFKKTSKLLSDRGFTVKGKPVYDADKVTEIYTVVDSSGVESTLTATEVNELLNPATNEGNKMTLTKKQREEIINELTTNCKCGDSPVMFDKNDKNDMDMLQNAKDEKLITMQQCMSKMKDMETNMDAMKDKASKYDDMMKKKKEEDDKKNMETKPTSNSQQPTKPEPKTAAQWLNEAPPEIQSTVKFAQQLEAQQRAGYVKAITANTKNKYTQEMLAQKPIEELQMLADMLGETQQTAQQPAINWGGMSTPTTHVQPQDDLDPPLLPMTVNWEPTFGNQKQA